jgi:hypothetical protein
MRQVNRDELPEALVPLDGAAIVPKASRAGEPSYYFPDYPYAYLEEVDCDALVGRGGDALGEIEWHVCENRDDIGKLYSKYCEGAHLTFAWFGYKK